MSASRRPPHASGYSQGFNPRVRTVARPILVAVSDRRRKKRRGHRNRDSGLAPPRKDTADWSTSSRSCALNLFCRRTSKGRYVGHQIQAIDIRRYDPADVDVMLREDPGPVYNDRRFFEELNEAYYTRICGFWRRWLSLKTLRTFQLVEFTRGRSAPLETVELAPDAFYEMLGHFHRPEGVKHNSYLYVDWVFHLRQEDKRHALEFVESWSGWRVAIAGCVPGVISTGVAMVWALKGGELSTVFTVASFILAAFALLAAVLGFVTGAER